MEEKSFKEEDFCKYEVGGFNYQVNRRPDQLSIMTDFSSVIPYYDDIDGLHLKATSEKAQKDNDIIPLKDMVSYTLRIDAANQMSKEQYLATYAEKRAEHVKNVSLKKTYAKGFEKPSPIQAISCVEIIKRTDCMIQSKSGTGKTHMAVFGLLWHFDYRNPNLQYVFMANTHEVANQFYEQIQTMLIHDNKNYATAKISLCIGHKPSTATGGFKSTTLMGTSTLGGRKSLREEIDEIKNAQILVCTMGKFYDFFINKKDKKIVNVSNLKAICVDEFDTIVISNKRSNTMSTGEQMAAIMQEIPETAQRVFCSATVPQEASNTAFQYFRDYTLEGEEPFVVLLNEGDFTLDQIRQYYVVCEYYSQKGEILLDLLKQLRIMQGIVFTNRTDTAIELKKLIDTEDIHISSAVFHGNLSETERQRIVQDLTSGKIRLLISTDIAARGLDIHGVNIVVNFDMPEFPETYIHRVGRSGRYGRKGVGISFLLVNPATGDNEMEKKMYIDKCSKNSKMEDLPSDLAGLL